MNRYLCVLVDEGFGSLTRYLARGAFVQQFSRLPHNQQLMEVVGFLGGYTTCSSFEYDGYLAARGVHHWTALAYLVGSVVLGYAGIWLGAFLVTKR